MKEKQRIYSYRKFKGIGLASAVVGLAFLTPSNGGGVMPVVHAESVTEHRDSSNLDNQSDKVVLKSAESASDAATNDAPRPEGNVVARGEDGVPWELYENGYLLFKPEAGKDTLTNNQGETSWKVEHGSEIKHVGFAGKVYAPEYSSYLFSADSHAGNYTTRNFNPTTFDTANLDTSKVTDMDSMFKHLSNLTDLDVTNFDTSNVVNMSFMFNGMSKLTNLDLTHFDTSNVTNMDAMFQNMSNLTHLDVTHFNTSNVTDMSGMFTGVSQLTTLDVTHFDTSKVTNMFAMFASMSNLTNLDVTHFNTSNVTSMSGMFHGVSKLTNLDVSQFDTSNVKSMTDMFADMSSLTNLDVTHFNTSNVTDMSGMFSGMSSLTDLDVTHFNTSNVTDMNAMFRGMAQLTNLDVTHFDTSNVTNMNWMFADMSNLTDLDVTHFNTSNVTSMSAMFSGMSKLTNLDVTHFNTSNVTDMYAMFRGMAQLTNLDVTHFDTSNVTNMNWMFADMSQLSNLDVTPFDTRKVTEMVSMFYGLSRLTHLDLTNFDTSDATDVRWIFYNMTYLKELKLGDKFKADGIRALPSEHSYGNQYTDKWHKVNDKGHPYTVSDWANLYSSNPSSTAGTWVREEASQDATLTFDGETLPPVTVAPNTPTLPELPRPTQPKPNHKFKGWSKTPDGEPIQPSDIQPGENITLHPIWEAVDGSQTRNEKVPVTKTYEADDTLDYGKQTETLGVEGEKTITTTYTVTPYTGELTNPIDSEVITTPMKPTVVKVGTKPTEDVEVIPSPKQYEKDFTRDKGQPDTVIEGRPGSKTTTTTYTVDQNDGTVTPKQGQPVIVEPTPTIVKVAAKDKTDVTPIPSPVVYESDKKRDKGTPEERTEGKPGSSTTVTTYTVNPQDGTVTENVGEPMRKEPTNTIVKVGAKDKVVETPIEPKVVYEKDETRDEGTPNQTTPGEKGKIVTTTTYDVNPNDGTVTETVGEPVVTPAGVTKVKVGAKPKVEIVKDGGKTIQRTMSYDVDPNTGKVTPHVNDQVIGDNGSITPPTVEIPEYNKPIGGADLDGEGGHITPPTVEIPEYNKPIGGAGLDGEGGRITPPAVEIPEYTETEQPQTLKPEITPPTVEVPEYTGTIGGAGLDGEGGLITPPTVDKPIYNGDIEPTIERQVIPSGKRYEKDDSREKGQPDITVPGKNGSVTTTFHYHVDKDGHVISSKGSSVTEEPVSTIIKVAAKDKVEVKVVESPKRYVGDDTKELGDDSETSGTPGEVHIRTIYDVNPETGDITERTEKDLRIVPTETVITKGTKPSVKTVERDGKVYEQTTTYTVNEKTGELTSSTTEKLIKDAEKQTETQKQLPNTGDAGALASLAGLGVGLLGVRLGRKREE